MVNMLFEVVEAINSCNLDDFDEDVKADTMVWLREHLNADTPKHYIYQWLYDHDRCCVCGQKLRQVKYKEWHPEVQEFEVFNAKMCPMCDDC